MARIVETLLDQAKPPRRNESQIVNDKASGGEGLGAYLAHDPIEETL